MRYCASNVLIEGVVAGISYIVYFLSVSLFSCLMCANVTCVVSNVTFCSIVSEEGASRFV